MAPLWLYLIPVVDVLALVFACGGPVEITLREE